MTRKGHPRVPRAIRGQRRRAERLAREAHQRRAVLNRKRYTLTRAPLADWERELLEGRPTVTMNKVSYGLPVSTDVLKDVYDPMLRAQLRGPIELPTPMSQRG